MLWLTADLHLGHANILRHAQRPYASLEEMERKLIAAINDRVSYTDDLWVLGDFSVRMDAEHIRRLRRRIVCQHVHLVVGNHDTWLDETERAGVFESFESYQDGLRSPAGRRLVLCHYPIADWNGQRRGSYMLHGHIHSKGSAYNSCQRAAGLLRYDVGVDANDYAPVSIEQIDQWFAGVDPTPVHHANAGR